MGTQKKPGTKKSANGAARASQRRELQPEPARLGQQPAESSSVAGPMLDLTKERTLTVREAAYRLGKSEVAIRHMLHAGRLRGWQVGGIKCPILVSEASVEEVLILGTIRFGF